MRSLTIAGKIITDDSDAWVIAELGHNHGGSLETAKAMIRAAAQAGADAVKLQKRDNRTLYTAEYYDRPYVSEHSYGATYGEHREALEFDFGNYCEVEAFNCDVSELVERYVAFVATVFDRESADCLIVKHDDGVSGSMLNAIKIASADIINLPLLKYVAEFGLPMIVSTGAATQPEVDRAVETIWPINQQVALLQCTAVYPAPPELLNLRCITTYRERYPELTIGFSSHYSGISDVVAAYVLGARIFEKHFTLSRTSKGSDHAFSLEPAGFAKMVSYLKNTRVMLGSGWKQVLEEEKPAIEKMRKSTRWWNKQYGEATT